MEKAIKNFDKLNVQTQLLLLLTACADENGDVRLKKEELANYLNTSRQTVGLHLRTLATCDLLKYKYSGLVKLNPEYYLYKKDEVMQSSAVEEYMRFNSDI